MYKKLALFLAILVILPLCACKGKSYDDEPDTDKDQAKINQDSKNIPDETRIKKQLGKVAPPFTANRGQIKNESVKYYLSAPGKSIYFTEDGIVMDLYKTKKKPRSKEDDFKIPDSDTEIEGKEGIVIRMRFVDAQTTVVNGEKQLEGKVNYFIGGRENWRSDISTYQEVVYKELYPKINLRCISSPRKLKYQFEVGNGADPKLIKVEYSGIEKLELDDAGNLLIKTEKGDIVDEKPHVYQIINNETVTIEATYDIVDSNTYAFAIKDYNREYPLIIDPGISYTLSQRE